jgi:hypothetical protein
MGQTGGMIKKRALLFSIATLPFVVAGCSIGGGDTYSGAQAANQGVTVQATGIVKVVPDGVAFNFAVSVLAASTDEALMQVAKGADKARGALEAAGVKEEDIASQNVSVYPEYSYSTNGSAGSVSGYRGTQAFAVTLRDTANAGQVVDAVVSAIGNSVQVNSVIPMLLDTNEAAGKAREEAVKSATLKAESYAKLFGAGLGDVQYVTEVLAPVSSAPRVEISASDMATTAKTEIDLGLQEVAVTIEVRFNLD